MGKVACLEEIALKHEMGYITKRKLLERSPFQKNQYGQYLIKRAHINQEELYKCSSTQKLQMKILVIIEPKLHGDARGYFVKLLDR